MYWLEHGVDVYFGGIHRQQRKVQSRKEIAKVLVEKVGDLLGKVWQQLVSPESHIHAGGTDSLLPSECTPSLATLAPTSKTVSNFAPSSRSSPNVASNSAGQAVASTCPRHYPRACPVPTKICLRPGDRLPWHRVYRIRKSNAHPKIPGRCRRFELNRAEHQ